MKKIIISLAISLSLIGVAAYVVFSESLTPGSEVAEQQNVEIRDGVQYVTIVAKGGYTPRVTEIVGGLPTKLIVKTDSTYDCSTSLIIRSIGFQKILQPTGEEVIDLGISKSGETIQGICGMGMYNFQIKTT